IGVVIAERTLYLPSVAVAALAALIWQKLEGRVAPARMWVPVLAAAGIIGALGVRTWVRNPVWDSTDSVWASMFRDQPLSYRTQWLHAVGAWQAERYDVAETRFRLAHRLYDRDS